MYTNLYIHIHTRYAWTYTHMHIHADTCRHVHTKYLCVSTKIYLTTLSTLKVSTNIDFIRKRYLTDMLSQQDMLALWCQNSVVTFSRKKKNPEQSLISFLLCILKRLGRHGPAKPSGEASPFAWLCRSHFPLVIPGSGLGNDPPPSRMTWCFLTRSTMLLRYPGCLKDG